MIATSKWSLVCQQKTVLGSSLAPGPKLISNRDALPTEACFKQRIENMLRRLWSAILIAALPLAAEVTSPTPHPTTNTLDQREGWMWKTLARDAQFTDVPHVSVRSRCEDVRPPQALTTPEPLLAAARGRMK